MWLLILHPSASPGGDGSSGRQVQRQNMTTSKKKPSHENMQTNDVYLGSAETAFETPTILDVWNPQVVFIVFFWRYMFSRIFFVTAFETSFCFSKKNLSDVVESSCFS